MSRADESGVQIGSILDGRYRIDGVLGTGGMGRVYRGEHTGIGKAVAIKVLHANLGRNLEAAQRFQREALASGRLDHANIVGVSDFGVIEDGPCYLVMEALEGESLGDRLQREKRIPWPDALAILRGVLHGLRHAHDRGVVHRDIKPDNVFLAQKDGELVIKILDFGIAKLAAGTNADDPAATRAGLTVGTPAYLSPEQAVGGAITPACDLYSTTIVLYEMLAGRTPFEESDPLSMLGAHVGREPPRLADVAPDLELPPGLEDVIDRGLAKLVGDRIPSAVDYLVLLDQVSPEPEPVRVRLSSQPSATMTPPVGLPTIDPAQAVSLGQAPTAALSTLDNARAIPAPFEIPKHWIYIAIGVVVAFLIGALVLFATRAPQTVTVPVPVPTPMPTNATPPPATTPAPTAPATTPPAAVVKPTKRPR